MRGQKLARSLKLLELGRIGMKSLLKEPVKEAVREALAEELAGEHEHVLSEDHHAHDHEDHTRHSDETEQDDSGGGMLKPALLLLGLGVVAVLAVKKRKKLMKVVKRKKSEDDSDESDTSTVSNQRSTTHADSIGRNESTSHMGEGESGSDQPKEYDVDSESEELSTTDS